MGEIDQAAVDAAERERLYHEAAADFASIAAKGSVVTTPAPHGLVTWRIWGTGSPLLLVHGGGGAWSHWIRNVLPLSRHYQVIAPDLPGFGDSQMESIPTNPSEVADILAAGLRSILDEGAALDVAGFSFGGVVSGHLAAHHPSLVASLNLVGAVGLGVKRYPPPAMGRVSRDMAIADRWAVQAANLKTLMIADERNIDGLAVYLQDRNTARTRLRSRPMSLKEPLGPLLGQIRCPISAVWGRQDAVYPDDTLERESLFQNLTPAVTPTFIDPGGHWIQFEQADIFNRYLLELLGHRLERPPTEARRGS